VRRIDLGAHDVLVKDPNILWLHVRLGVLLFLLGATLSVVGFFLEGRPKGE
jgi:hypothetical protein